MSTTRGIRLHDEWAVDGRGLCCVEGGRQAREASRYPAAGPDEALVMGGVNGI